MVCVEISGEGELDFFGTREDGGLVKRLVKFQEENKVYPIMNEGYADTGSYRQFFGPEDATKIKAWLLEQGVEHK